MLKLKILEDVEIAFAMDESIKIAQEKFKDYNRDLFDIFAKKQIKLNGELVMVDKIT